MSTIRKAFPWRTALGRGILTGRSQPAQRAWRLIGKRGYASGGHGEHKAGSDLPWAITSIGVGVPVAAWLWSQGPSAHSNDHHGDSKHGDGHGGEEDSHESEDSENKADGDQEDGKAQDSDNGSKDGSKGHDDDAEAGEDTDKEAAEEKTDDEGKSDADSESDSEGAEKDTPDTSDDEKEKDGSDKGKAKPDGPNAASGAMHRARSHDDKSLSKKGEGLHDTAKVTGTVDSARKAK